MTTPDLDGPLPLRAFSFWGRHTIFTLTMTNLPSLLAKDPTEVGFPPTLPLELAARVAPVKDICEGYGIDKDEWAALRLNPVFQQACEEAAKIVSEPNGTFKLKSHTMAEALLPRMMELATHKDFEAVPASVQADMCKSLVRFAGLDQSIDQKGAAAGKAIAQNPLMIQINLR